MTEALGGADAAPVLRRIGAQLLVRGWLSANNIVFRGQGGEVATVVDTGYVSHADQTVALVRSALAGRPLSRIINTHLHSDHCGGNAALCRRWPGTAVCVPSGYRAAVQPWDDELLSYRLTGQACEPFEVAGFIASGDVVSLGGRAWQVHGTPGHDPDAVVLFEPRERVLISGDALWASRLAIIFPALSGEGGFDEAHRALELIERLSPRLVLPGHGEAFTDTPSAIAQSRMRLDAFQRAPERHRLHAARALVVYHMLEVRHTDRARLVHWISRTPIFLQAFRCGPEAAEAEAHAAATVDRLVRDGVLRANGNSIQVAGDPDIRSA